MSNNHAEDDVELMTASHENETILDIVPTTSTMTSKDAAPGPFDGSGSGNKSGSTMSGSDQQRSALKKSQNAPENVDENAASMSMGKSMRRVLIQERKEEDDEKLTAVQKRIHEADQIFLNNCKQIFQKFDEDNSGTIDREELQNVLESMGYELDDDQVQELLSQVDVDGGGTLDIDEFTVLLELWKEAAQYKIFESEGSVNKQHMDQSVERKISAMIDDGRWRWAWQIILMLVALYFWLSVWILWNWNNDKERRTEVERGFLAPDIICTLVLLIEMVLRFRIGFLRDDVDGQREELVDDKKEIAIRYLRTWFLYDFITMLPMRFFSPDWDTAFALRHIRLLLVLRIPFLFNKSKMVNITSAYVNFHFAFLPFFELFIAFASVILTLAMIHQDLLRQAVDLGLAPAEEAHFASAFYWTLYVVAGVGYGDMAPYTDGHRWYASFLFVFSMIANGLFVGSMVTLMQEADVEVSRQTRLVQTQAVLQFFEVPQGLEEEILQFQNHTLARDIAISYKDLVGMLPVDMRESILMQSRVPLLQQVQLFRGTHVSTLVQLADRLQQSTVVPEQYIAMYGEENYGMFVLNYGFVDCSGPNGHYLCTLKREDAFGEPGLLRENVHFEINFKALTYCDLFALTREDLNDIARRYPRFQADLKAVRFLVKCRYTEALREQENERKLRFAEAKKQTGDEDTAKAQDQINMGKMMVTLSQSSANAALQEFKGGRRPSRRPSLNVTDVDDTPFLVTSPTSRPASKAGRHQGNNVKISDDHVEVIDGGEQVDSEADTAAGSSSSNGNGNAVISPNASADEKIALLEEQSMEATQHIAALEAQILSLLAEGDGNSSD